MSAAVLLSPPAGVTMRPFRIVVPNMDSPEFDDIMKGDPDEVVCVGPFEGKPEARLFGVPEAAIRYQLKPAGFANVHLYICSADYGRYVVLWRVSKGRPRARGPNARANADYPPRKLSHWDELQRDVAMMLCPEPDDAVVEGAILRCRYMRAKGRGGFQLFFDEAGALWVAKVSDAPRTNLKIS